jgi:hypothetical protein
MAPHLKAVKGKTVRESPEIFRPSIHLEEDQLKEIKNWEVGEKYTLILEVTQKSKRENSDKKISASFDIMKIGTPNKGFNHKTMEAFRAGKLMDGKRHISNISEAMKMASG